MLQSFIFDQSKGETPETVARKRAIADALMGRIGNRSARNTGEGIGNALASIGHGISSNVMNRRASRAEQEGQQGAGSLYDQIISGLTSGSPIALSGGSQPTDYASSQVDSAHQASASPGQFAGSQQEFIDMLMPAAIEASQRTGIDPRIIVAQAAQETGWGRSAPGNNFFGIKSHGQGGGRTLNTHEYVDGQRVNTADSFRTFGSPEDSVQGYADFITSNPRYKPLMEARGLDDQLAALQASGYATDPNYANSVGSIARSIPANPSQADLESMPVGGQMQMGQGEPVQTAQAGGLDLPTLLQAASNPWLNEGQRGVINMLIEQQMQQQDPMQSLEMEYKRAQIEKMQRSAAGGDTRYGLNPIYGQDAQGNTVLGVLGNDGTFKPVDTGEVDVSTGVDRVDLGTQWGLLDKRSGQMVGTLPKENYQEAFDKGAGAEAGKAQAEAQASLPTDLATAEQAIKELDALIEHPGLNEITGAFDQFRPSWSMRAEGRDALARFNQAKGRAFLQAYGMLKGGGQITEVEGLKAEQAMARMDRAQSEADFKQALKDFRDAVATGMDKLRQKAGVTNRSSPISIDGYTIEQVE